MQVCLLIYIESNNLSAIQIHINFKCRNISKQNAEIGISCSQFVWGLVLKGSHSGGYHILEPIIRSIRYIIIYIIICTIPDRV